MSHRHRYSALRYPRTTQERRISGSRSACYDDGKYVIRCRAKRNKSNLPNAWDDLIRGDIDCKSWKKLRKSRRQWNFKKP